MDPEHIAPATRVAAVSPRRPLAVSYVCPDADARVGDVVEALDHLAELVPRATIVITELRRKTTQPRTGGGDARPP